MRRGTKDFSSLLLSEVFMVRTGERGKRKTAAGRLARALRKRNFIEQKKTLKRGEKFFSWCIEFEDAETTLTGLNGICFSCSILRRVHVSRRVLVKGTLNSLNFFCSLSSGFFFIPLRSRPLLVASGVNLGAPFMMSFGVRIFFCWACSNDSLRRFRGQETIKHYLWSIPRSPTPM